LKTPPQSHNVTLFRPIVAQTPFKKMGKKDVAPHTIK